MFVISNPKGTHLWLFSNNFSKKYSSSVWYIQLTERKNLWLIDWLIDWCLTSSEQFFSYIQDENI
jgi:hypothetical protein